MELEPRTTAPAHATGAVEFVPLAAIADDATFRLRDEGDVALLAASMARLGQLVPVELRAVERSGGERRFQLVAGFRRLAAVRLLARDRILARVHDPLEDGDAWGIALGEALLVEPLLGSELEALRARLAETRAAPWAEELVDEALVRVPVDPKVRERFLEFLSRAEPEEQGGKVEVTADELAADLARRMFEANQDLATAFEAWGDLPAEGRRAIVAQARYVAALLPLLEGEP